METLNENVINEKVEAYRLALIANTNATKAEIAAKEAKMKARKALQLAREELMSLTNGSYELEV